MTTRLPFTLAPLPAEPFGLWWHTYAIRLGVTRADLADAAGLPAGTQPGPEHASLIAAAAGLTAGEVSEMFTGTRPCPPEHVLRVWTPQPTSRFCPVCLGEGGRWQPGWAIPLMFHCLPHNTPLATRCPACGHPQARPAAPAESGPSRLLCSCGRTLAVGPRHRGDSGGAAMAAQRLIVTALTRLRHPGLTSQEREQAQNDLTDLTLIALHLHHGTVSKRGFAAEIPTAAALIKAVTLFTSHSRHRDQVPDLVTRCFRGPRSHAIPSSWRAASPTLITRIARGRHPRLTPIERIRYATTLPAPTPRPRQALDPAPGRAARLPDQLWPTWAIRLADDDYLDGPVFRSAMIAALLLPHSALQLNELTPLLPHRPSPDRVAHQLRRLGATPRADAALQILTELGLALDHHAIPINYPRRRQLVADTELIDKQTWHQYCHDTGLRTGRQRRLGLARSYLYELLTGGNLATAAEPYFVPEGAPRIDYAEFCASMPAALATALTAHAEQLLATAGITGEPLCWRPPDDWVTVTDWPGADPEHTDPGPIHDALRAQWTDTTHQHWEPTNAVAGALGISSHHLRHVLRLHPIDHAPYLPHRAGAVIPMTATEHHGLGHRAYPHVDDPKRVFLVDPSWLRTQYVTWGRSLPHIATEIGCRPCTLRAFAQAQGIPRRPRSGGRGCLATSTTTAHPADFPDPLRKALRGQRARDRLERFLLMTEYPSLNQAANAHGIRQNTLTAQLKILERDCDGPLFQRNPHPQPLGPLTPLGEQLCQQIHDHLDPAET
ncbi:TniQ family protein [Amycolatopsis sp. NPDC059657]|uniref:TniQ family protein n=1 Tax=Amycolatopsis sp. NPDC059657 TaxID=3346899 RepID=UPI00366E5285